MKKPSSEACQQAFFSNPRQLTEGGNPHENMVGFTAIIKRMEANQAPAFSGGE
jgi:hypothetical protein